MTFVLYFNAGLVKKLIEGGKFMLKFQILLFKSIYVKKYVTPFVYISSFYCRIWFLLWNSVLQGVRYGFSQPSF